MSLWRPVAPHVVWRRFASRARRTKRDTADETSRARILEREIAEAVGQRRLTLEDVQVPRDAIERYMFRERPQRDLEVEIVYQTSEGDGLGIAAEEGRVLVVKVPKTVVGDTARVRLARHFRYYAEARLVETPGDGGRRRNGLVACGVFARCSGCQLQMMPYEEQLRFKREVVQRAFRFFFPGVGGVIGGVVESPMQYGYRTKLTPHCVPAPGAPSGAPGALQHAMGRLEPPRSPGATQPPPGAPDGAPGAIGFNSIEPGRVVDVTHCPIATTAINERLPSLRREIAARGAARGATALLRESVLVSSTGAFRHSCVTSPSSVVTQHVDGFTFQFAASEFFQTNAAVLPHVLAYVRHHVAAAGARVLVDAFCGSGLFGIALSPAVERVFGVEVSHRSIEYARHNAELNGVGAKVQYIEGDANAMFGSAAFGAAGICGADSVVVMDPSRKGSSEGFMRQLLAFGPRLVAYVSCNVFTQARDLATLDRLQRERGEVVYRVREVTGFDFFPQTKHVESVAIIERVPPEAREAREAREAPQA